jgi:hypothetical protein
MLHYRDIEDWNGKFAEIEIEYDYCPGLCPSMTSRDGWDPGWPAEVEIISVEVGHFEGIDRQDMGGWEKDLDRLALDYVLDLDLERELIDSAEAYDD